MALTIASQFKVYPEEVRVDILGGEGYRAKFVHIVQKSLTDPLAPPEFLVVFKVVIDDKSADYGT